MNHDIIKRPIIIEEGGIVRVSLDGLPVQSYSIELDLDAKEATLQPEPTLEENQHRISYEYTPKPQ